MKEAKIGRAIMDADIVISPDPLLRGMRQPVLEAHLRTWAWEAAPEPARWRCTTPVSLLYIRINVSDAAPVRETAPTAPSRSLNAKPPLIQARCVGCGRCIGACPVDAVDSMCDEANDILNRKIAEYTLAVLKDVRISM